MQVAPLAGRTTPTSSSSCRRPDHRAPRLLLSRRQQPQTALVLAPRMGHNPSRLPATGLHRQQLRHRYPCPHHDCRRTQNQAHNSSLKRAVPVHLPAGTMLSEEVSPTCRARMQMGALPSRAPRVLTAARSAAHRRDPSRRQRVRSRSSSGRLPTSRWRRTRCGDWAPPWSDGGRGWLSAAMRLSRRRCSNLDMSQHSCVLIAQCKCGRLAIGEGIIAVHEGSRAITGYQDVLCDVYFLYYL
jgi:hypothetical protein